MIIPAKATTHPQARSLGALSSWKKYHAPLSDGTTLELNADDFRAVDGDLLRSLPFPEQTLRVGDVRFSVFQQWVAGRFTRAALPDSLIDVLRALNFRQELKAKLQECDPEDAILELRVRSKSLPNSAAGQTSSTSFIVVYDGEHPNAESIAGQVCAAIDEILVRDSSSIAFGRSVPLSDATITLKLLNASSRYTEIDDVSFRNDGNATARLPTR